MKKITILKNRPPLMPSKPHFHKPEVFSWVHCKDPLPSLCSMHIFGQSLFINFDGTYDKLCDKISYLPFVSMNLSQKQGTFCMDTTLSLLRQEVSLSKYSLPSQLSTISWGNLLVQYLSSEMGKCIWNPGRLRSTLSPSRVDEIEPFSHFCERQPRWCQGCQVTERAWF